MTHNSPVTPNLQNSLPPHQESMDPAGDKYILSYQFSGMSFILCVDDLVWYTFLGNFHTNSVGCPSCHSRRFSMLYIASSIIPRVWFLFSMTIIPKWCVVMGRCACVWATVDSTVCPSLMPIRCPRWMTSLIDWVGPCTYPQLISPEAIGRSLLPRKLGRKLHLPHPLVFITLPWCRLVCREHQPPSNGWWNSWYMDLVILQQRTWMTL